MHRLFDIVGTEEMRIIDACDINTGFVECETPMLIQQHIYAHLFQVGQHLHGVVITEYAVYRCREIFTQRRHTFQHRAVVAVGVESIIPGKHTHIVA